MGKSFKETVRTKQASENPAMQFFSSPAQEEEVQTEAPETEDQAGNQGGDQEGNQEGKHSAPISPAPIRRAAPEKEAKSRRLQLLLTPSLHAALKEKADQERRSVNDLINLVLEGYLQQ